MFCDIRGQVDRCSVKKFGEKSFHEVTLVLMGMTLRFSVPEEYVPDFLEGHEVVVRFRVEAGKWGKPELRFDDLVR